MSEWKSSRGPVPARWLHCPRKAIKLIHNKFLAFKTPLSSAFDSQVPAECRFNVDMLFSSVKSQRLKIGLWIDLTNTNRFYDKSDVEAHGCRYLKLQCRGHGETPSAEQTADFVRMCKNFIAQHPLEIVGVHCTHGFNRTGFMVISYLVETEVTNVDAGLAEFATARPPGIYKADYIRELFKRYDDEEDTPAPPTKPAWCLEYDDSNTDEVEESSSSESTTSSQAPGGKRKREFQNKNPTFMEGVPGVTPLTDSCKISGIQRRVQEMCRWESTGFPGSQPVSMDRNNIRLLNEKPYRVSWKADGTRYMLLIQGDRELYFIDRDNSIFQVEGLAFPHPVDRSRCLRDTLLDGEMVIDRADGKEYPRYLAYDIITYDGRDVAKKAFHPDRYSIIERDVMGGRLQALKAGLLRREREPFSIRLKHFYAVTQASNLLGDKFAKQLGHEPDGLIFQPANEPYTPGVSNEVLKWKPSSLNSVDFKLKIVMDSGHGILPRKIGRLFVGGMNEPFDQIKITKATKSLNNKIIECKYDSGQWVFMRERTDKSFPNSFKTAKSVCQSIREPVTTEALLSYIERHRFAADDADLMPPPRHEPRHEARHEPRNEVRHEQRNEVRHEQRNEVRHEQRNEVRHEQRNEVRHEQRNEVRHEQRNDVRHEPRNEVRHEPRNEVRHEPRNEQRIEQRHEPRREPREEAREDSGEESPEEPPVKRRRSFIYFADRSVQIWCTKDLASKERKSVRINLGYDHGTHVRWSPDGKAFIVHNAMGNSMDVWKLTKSTKKGDFAFKSATKVLEFPKHHTEDIVGMDIACNGRFIITCSNVNDLIVWDLKGEQLATIDTYLGSTHRARISPCGRFVAVSGFTPDVKVWEVLFTKTGEFKQVAKAFDLAGHSSGVYDFNFCADTSHMASVSKDGTYRFYDTKIEFEKGEDPRLLVKGSWDVATPASIAVSPNGEVVVVAHGSSLTFYSTVTGTLDTTIDDIFNGPITCLTFDAAGEFVLVSGDKQIKIFRNVAGYRAAIESANRKLQQRQSSATKERLEETIAKSKSFLTEMGEPLS